MNEKLKHLSLRTLLMLLVGVLVAVALAFALRDLQQSWAMRGKAVLLTERNHVAEHCMLAVKHFAFERGRTHMLLNGNSPIGPEDRRFIDERRTLADTHVAEVLSLLPDALHDKGEALQNRWQGIKDLRQTVDAQLALRQSERDPALATQWPLAANALMASLDQALIAVSISPDEMDARFERMSHLRVLTLEFRDMAGRESRQLATELSLGRVPNPELQTEQRLMRGRLLQLWAEIEPAVDELADRDTQLALGKVRSELFGRLRPLQDQMLAEAARNMRAPITLNTYLAASVSALDSAVELAESINRKVAVYTQARLERANEQALVSLLGIVAILVLAALVVMLLLRRFTRPLNEILRRIDTLIARQATQSRAASATLQGDDFDKVSQALSLLDESMAARLRSDEELQQSMREQGKQNNLLSAILETIPVGVFMVEAPSGKPLLANNAAGLLLGRGVNPEAQIEGLAQAYAAFKLPERIPYPVDEMPLVKAMQGVVSYVDDMLVVGPDGIERTLEAMGVPVRDDEGRIWASVASFIDVTGRARSAAEMTLLAYYDALTKLPNRRLFDDRMHVAINQAKRDKTRVALLMIDLDRFKPVNDTYGHAVGDLLLKAVALRMQMCLRESDTLARVGGDEFSVILPGISSEADAVVVGEKIRAALCEPFDLDGGYQVSIACCIGVALYPEHGPDETRLARSADEAMYRAKELGRNQVQVFVDAAGAWGSEGYGADKHAILHLAWHKSYQCGASSIDDEHRELFNLANQLISASVASDGDIQKVSLALEALIASVVRHFSHEEEILAAYRYDGLAEHAQQHHGLVQRAKELRRLAAEGELTLGELVVFIVQDVVAGHMLHEDHKYFAFLKAAMNNMRNELGGDHREQ